MDSKGLLASLVSAEGTIGSFKVNIYFNHSHYGTCVWTDILSYSYRHILELCMMVCRFPVNFGLFLSIVYTWLRIKADEVEWKSSTVLLPNDLNTNLLLRFHNLITHDQITIVGNLIMGIIKSLEETCVIYCIASHLEFNILQDFLAPKCYSMWVFFMRLVEIYQVGSDTYTWSNEWEGWNVPSIIVD